MSNGQNDAEAVPSSGRESAEGSGKGLWVACALLADAMGANPDVFAWLDVPGTNVSLPLCQRAGDDAYYLTHAASGAEAPFGAAYVESANSADMGDPLTVAYGHTTRGGPQAMFTQLHLLGYAPLFEGAGELHVHLPGRVLDYRIVAAGVVSDEHILDAVGSSAAARQAYLDALTDAGLPCNLVRDGARVDAATDRVLQLSTCSNYGYEDRRFVVTAVLAGEREVVPDD